MNDRERDVAAKDDSGVRAGGDVQTKGPSAPAPSDAGATTRAGGDVQTKGASKDEPDDTQTQTE